MVPDHLIHVGQQWDEQSKKLENLKNKIEILVALKYNEIVFP